MCHEPTSVGLPEGIGIGKGTMLLEDFQYADAIFVVGQNPGTNSPRIMTELRNVSRRGMPIVVLNPLRERALERFAAPQDPIEMATFQSTRIASEYCQVRVGGDIGALKGVMKLVLEAHEKSIANGDEPVLDLEFIERHTHGFEALDDDLHRVSWDNLLHVSGLAREQIERIAAIYVRARAVIVCYGMGITQHRTGSANVQQRANLRMLRGNFGKPGARICLVRGHSNVQGDRTKGIDEMPGAELLDQIKAVFGFEPPRAHDHAVTDAVRAMIDGQAKVFVGMGGNFVAAVPDRPLIEAAMRKLRPTVCVNTKLNRGGFKVRPYNIPRGSMAAYYPETNALLPLSHRDLKSKTPAAQSIPVLVRPQSNSIGERYALLAPGRLGATESWSLCLSDEMHGSGMPVETGRARLMPRVERRRER